MLAAEALWRVREETPCARPVGGANLDASGEEALLAWGPSGAQALWLDAPPGGARVVTVPGSAGLWAAAAQGRDALVLHGGVAPRLERWRLRPSGLDEPDTEPLSVPDSALPARPLGARVIPTAQGVRIAWVERRRAVWGAPKGLVAQALPIDLDDARWAGVAAGRAYWLVQQHQGALHGPWWWLSLDLAHPDLPPWIAPALRAGLLPLAATACERHGLFAATREGLWWFDRQGQRRDLVPWPLPDLSLDVSLDPSADTMPGVAQVATLCVAPNRRDLLLSVDGIAWRWDMKPLRGRRLPLLRPLRIPRGLSERDLADAARAAFGSGEAPAPALDEAPTFAQPTGTSPDGVTAWRRLNAAPCYTKPPSQAPSHPAGVIDLTIGADAAWELYSGGLLRRRPHARGVADEVRLVIPAPVSVQAAPDGALAVIGQGHITWLAGGRAPLASLALAGEAQPPAVSASALGWVIGDGTTWRALTRDLTPLADAPRGLSPSAPGGGGTTTDPSARAALRLDLRSPHGASLVTLTDDALCVHDDASSQTPLPAGVDQAALEPTGRALALRSGQGVTLWPSLDPNQATSLLSLPADLVGWLDGDLLLHFRGETWRVTPSALPPAPCAPAEAAAWDEGAAGEARAPLTPPFHVVVDISDLSDEAREAAALLAHEAADRWPTRPPRELASLLVRAARALTTAQRLRLLASEADADLGDLQRRADVSLSPADLETLRGLLQPVTFGRLLASDLP